MNFKKLLAQSIVWRGFFFVTLFGVNIALSRYLQAGGAGRIYYISNTFSLIQLVAGCCLESGITYFAAGKIINANKLLWLCFIYTIGIALLLSAGIHFYTNYFGDSLNNGFNIPVYIFCFIIGLMLTNYGCNLFYARGNFLIPNVIMGLINVAFIAAAIVLHNQNTAGGAIINLYFYTFLVQGFAVFAAYIFWGKSWQQISLPLLTQVKHFFRYSAAVLAANVLFFFVYRVDYYFVHGSKICTAADLGNYVQVSKLGQMLLVLPQIIASAVYPQMSSGENRQAVSEVVMLLARIFSAVFLLLIVFVAVCGKWLFPFVFGATFNQMQAPMLLLLPGIFCLSVLVILSSFFSGKGNVKVSIYAAFAALAVVLTGDYFFVPVYGIIAAALVSTIGYLVNLGWYLRQFSKDYQLSMRQFFSWRKNDVLLLIALLKKKK